MGMKPRVLLLVWLLSCASLLFAADEPGRFAVSQAAFQAPVLTTYLDVLNQDGRPPAELSASELSANVSGRPLKVISVTPFDASGEGVAYIFLVDVSKSIQRTQFEEMRAAIDDWIDVLNAPDRMTIYTFGEQDRLIIDFTSDKASLKAALRSLAPTDLQTKLYQALQHAISLDQRTDAGLPNRRVIVILSDGKDEGSGLNTDDVRALVQQSPMPIYAIGSSQLRMPEKTQYLEELHRIATLSGGLYLENKSLPAAYGQMKEAIRRVFVARLGCDGCSVTTQTLPLEMTLKTGNTARTDRLPVRLLVPATVVAPTDEPWWKDLVEKITWKIALSIVLVLGVALVVVIRVVITIGKKPEPVPPPPPVPIPAIAVTPIIAVEAGRKLQLTVVSGNERGRVDKISLSGKKVVGRDKQCDIAYPNDSEMSARHYELIPAGQHVEISDLGSTNGTLLNGARLQTQQRVEDGDLVRAGRTEVRISIGA